MITFDQEKVKAIIGDMCAGLGHHMPARVQAGDFARLSAGQRLTVIEQALLFFNCRQLAKTLAGEENIERVAELISRHMGKEAGHELCFKTSGSSGQPLLHKHTLFALQAEVRSFTGQAGIIKRVVSVVPRYHLYGCSFAFLLPGILKIPVLQVPFPALGGIMEQLEDGDLLVGFPLFWLHLCALGRPFRSKVYGLTSTGPCPPRVFDELGRLGINCLYEIYGSSETGAAGIRSHYQDNFALLPHWQRYDEQTLQRAAASGAYERIILPDKVWWADERSFRLIARKDQAVQVGGSNVYPRQIAALIETHPAVKFCRVRLMDDNEGSRLKALVVPREIPFAAEALGNELTAWCRGRLAPAQRPRSFTFADQLPVNHLGKETNWSIAK
jgi:4-coumarate--CoA ligase (photoactive yellow protein activation family)